MKNILLTSLSAIIVAGIVGGSYAATTLLTNRDRVIENCLRISSYTSQRSENGATITTVEPIETAVQNCLALHQIKVK
jgi:hypothetical protein